jgi:hypothetical protein
MLRIFDGVTILSLAFCRPKTMWAFLGFVPLVTGVFGFCSAYARFGIKTCKLRNRCGAQ